MNDKMFTKYFEDLEFDVAGYRVTLDILGVDACDIDYRITDVQIINNEVKAYPYRTGDYFYYCTDLNILVKEYFYNLSDDIKENFDGFLSELYCK